MMSRYENYRTRRVPIYMVNTTNNTNWPVISSGQRLDALRELMRLEMPDTWQDVTSPPQTTPPGGGTPLARPSLSSAYLRRYNALNPTQPNQGAECLYLICTTGVSDELDAREQFRQNEIGDVDGDGAQEFLDAWGTPISFIRWAPGFISELQTTVDPDPFDPRHVYPSITGAPGAGSVYPPTSNQKTPTFALYPLIFSAGPDRLYGINKPTTSNYAANNNDPFLSVYAGGGMLFGQRADVDSAPPSNTTTFTAADDIYNHLMGTK